MKKTALALDSKLCPLLAYPSQEMSEFESRHKEIQALGIQRLREAGNKWIQGISVLGKGYCGVVVLADWLDSDQTEKTVALKVRRTDASQSSLAKEARHLAIANTLNIGPKLYAHSQNCIVMAYLNGPTIQTWLQNNATTKTFIPAMHHLLWQCYRLDQAGLDHGNLRCITEHVIMQDDLPVLIDFSSSSRDRRPANVTTLIQGVLWGTVLSALITKFMKIPSQEEFIPHLRQYKRRPSLESFHPILELFHP